MFSLRDLRFVLYSLELDVVRHRLFYLNYPQINEVAKADHMFRTRKHEKTAV